jgi:hypothetical protein
MSLGKEFAKTLGVGSSTYVMLAKKIMVVTPSTVIYAVEAMLPLFFN